MKEPITASGVCVQWQAGWLVAGPNCSGGRWLWSTAIMRLEADARGLSAVAIPLAMVLLHLTGQCSTRAAALALVFEAKRQGSLVGDAHIRLRQLIR